MKRPFGVVFAAVVLLLGSLLQLLMAAAMAFTGVFLPMQSASSASPAAPMPPWMSTFMYAVGVFFLALAVWGIVTTVGLFRLRNWARYSVLVIGGGIAVIGLISLLTSGLIFAVPMPLPPGTDPSQADIMHSVRIAIVAVSALFYGLVCATGISWLIYFNLKRVRALFAAAAGQLSGTPAQFAGTPVELVGIPSHFVAPPPQVAQSPRPFLISLLAVLNLIGAGCCLFMTLLPIPAVAVGVILHGWQKIVLYLVFGVLQAAVGVGLWQLKEWGRLLALTMTALAVVQCGVYVVRPSLMLRYNTEMYRMMGLPQQQLPERFQTIMYSGMFGFSVLLCIAIAAVLIHYRPAFRRPNEHEPQQPALSQ